MKKSISIKIMLVAGFLLTAFVANADKLDLSQGTMTTGGTAAFVIDPTLINNIQSSNLGWKLNVDFGYFVVDNLDINLAVSTGGHFSLPISDASVGFGLGAHYYFDLGSMISPYVGLVPQILWNNTGTVGPSVINATGANWNLRLPVSAGVLIALNSHVALDLGAEAGFSWGLSTGSTGTAFDMTVGYVGIRAFF